MERVRPARVLWLAKGLGPGGMEYLLVNAARTRDTHGFDYQVAYLVDIPNPITDQLIELGVPCTRLGTGRAADLRWLRDLRELVRDQEIDLVHIHSPQTAALARPALRLMRNHPRIFYTEHNSWGSYRAPTRLANAATSWLNDDQIGVSTDVVESIPRPLRHGISPLTHGIDRAALRRAAEQSPDVRRELGIPDSAFVILAVANLKSQKAYEVMLDAAATVMQTHDDVVFLSVGQGPLLDELEARRDELDLGDRFRFLGYRSDIAALLHTADVFTLSSRFEGLPVALMEAMALGKPVVATAVGGIPTAIEDDVSGFLVKPGDPAALAAAYERVISDAPLRSRLSAAAEQRSAQFDAATASAVIEDHYRSLLAVT